MPTTVIGLEKWLQERWLEKEKILEAFYTEKEELPQTGALPTGIRSVLPLQYFCLVKFFEPNFCPH